MEMSNGGPSPCTAYAMRTPSGAVQKRISWRAIRSGLDCWVDAAIR